MKLINAMHNIEIYIITNYYNLYERLHLELEHIIHTIDCLHLLHII